MEFYILSISTILFGWNDAEYLGQALNSLVNQTVKQKIVYVDDDSTDDSVEIAKDYVDEIVRLKRDKSPPFHNVPSADNVNAGLNVIDEWRTTFFMVASSDIILEPQYVEKLISKFGEDPKLVISSGRVKGEYTVETAPRGSGRMFRASWFKKHVGRHPDAYIWESYPVYKALSLGFNVRRFNEVVMTTLRPTKRHKPHYGYAMRQLGYHPLYAYARCFLASRKHLLTGLNMLKTYREDGEVYDLEVQEYLRNYQRHHIKDLFAHPLKHLRARVLT